ncbi:MAG TPA: hypothetical protein VEJ18_02485 [Planctomycetota bacterium]|nr:hypothetical protein [Planctomycetota bacterium]
MTLPLVPLGGSDGPDPVGAAPVQEEIRRLLRRQSQALRAGNAALSALLGTACEGLAGELAFRRGLGGDASVERGGVETASSRPRSRETQADFGDFAR